MGNVSEPLHTLPEPPPSVDGGEKKGAGSDGKSLPAACNGMSKIKIFLKSRCDTSYSLF